MLSIEDELAIQNVVSLYHHLIDARGARRLGEVFTEDAVLDLSAFGLGVFSGLPAIIERFEIPQDLTHTSTTLRTFEDEQGAVRAVSKTVGVGDDGRVVVSLHNDLMRRTSDGWRSAHLLITAPRS
jgi:hypothetical protein